jgi:transposase
LPKAQKEPLRLLSQQEQQALQQIVKATAERMDVIKRARALLAVADGQSFSVAAREAGFATGDTVCHLVKRFNQQGLSALLIATGRGRKPTYTHEQRHQILTELQREPMRTEDGTATWSLSLLQQRLRATSLPEVGMSTIRRTLVQAGYVYGQSRTWCQTGTVLRKRKEGVVSVQDPKTEEKKT